MIGSLKKFFVLAGISSVAISQSLAQDADAESAEPSLTPRYTLKTNMGDILIELDGENAPVTTQNFHQYVTDDFYDNTLIHRVAKGFVLQGGGFDTDMNRKETRDPIINESENGLKNLKGTLSMARLRDPDSATSQFFINVKDNPNLDYSDGRPGYAVFGSVVEGMEVVEAIEQVETGSHPRLRSLGPAIPKENVVIEDVVISAPLDEERLSEAVEAKMQAVNEAKMAFKFELEEEHGGSFETTDSGLQYMHVTEGEGDQPSGPTASVTVHYTGTLTDGTKFDSSRDRGQPATFQLNRVIKGWTEGLQLMKTGGRTIFVIPSDLGYGDRGNPPTIPGGATLVFDVELIEVN